MLVILVSIYTELRRIHQVEISRKHGNTGLSLKIEGYPLSELLIIRTFCIDEDNTIGTARALDCSRRSILKHSDRFNI